MKKIMTVTSYFLFITLLLLTACKKNNANTGRVPSTQLPPQLPPDTLGGREFLFAGTFIYGYDEFMEAPEVYLTTPVRPDVFHLPYHSMEVSLKFDTSAVWMTVQNYYHSPAANYLWYYVSYTAGFLRVLLTDVDLQLAGKHATVKVKFL